MKAEQSLKNTCGSVQKLHIFHNQLRPLSEHQPNVVSRDRSLNSPGAPQLHKSGSETSPGKWSVYHNLTWPWTLIPWPSECTTPHIWQAWLITSHSKKSLKLPERAYIWQWDLNTLPPRFQTFRNKKRFLELSDYWWRCMLYCIPEKTDGRQAWAGSKSYCYRVAQGAQHHLQKTSRNHLVVIQALVKLRVRGWG